MPTRNVVLTDHHEEVIDSLVRSGRYQNASEVLREGLRLVERREAEDAAKLERLRAAVDAGWREVEEGRYEDLAAEDMAEYIADLGRQAHERVLKEG